MPNISYDSQLWTLGIPQAFHIMKHFHYLILPLSTVINVITLYAVIKKTSPFVGELRYYILVHQICNTAADIVISGLIQVVFIYPYCGMVTIGFLNSFVPVLYQYACFTALLTSNACSIVNAAFYRYQSLLALGHPLKLKNDKVHKICICTFVFYFLHGALHIVIRGDSNPAVIHQRVLATFPFFNQIINQDFIFIDICFPYNTFYVVAAIFTFVSLSPFIPFFLIGCRNALLQNKMLFSNRTRQMQARFTAHLTIQLIVPLFMLGLPATYIPFSILFLPHNNYTYKINLIMTITLGCHSTISSILTLFLWKSYRMWILHPISQMRQAFSSKMSGIHFIQV